MNKDTILPVLHALYVQSSEASFVDVGVLSRRTGFSPIRVAEALLHLERKGLCDASRCRLTMHGLVIASTHALALERAANATAVRAA